MKLILAWIVVLLTIMLLLGQYPIYFCWVLYILLLIWAVVFLIVKYLPEDWW